MPTVPIESNGPGDSLTPPGRMGGMGIKVLTSGTTKLGTGWVNESHTEILSSGTLDATAAPGKGPRLTVISVVSSLTVVAARGSQISLTGWSLLGSRKVAATPLGDGPQIEVRAITILGSVRVKLS
jgi:hypothetical protein